jgi:hypothetical protein
MPTVKVNKRASKRTAVGGIQRSGQVFKTKATATGVGLRPSKNSLRLMTGRGVGVVKTY